MTADTPCLDHLIRCNHETGQWFDPSFLPRCRAELVALKATASRAEALERVRIAAANVAAMYQTDPLLTVDGLTDTEFLARINTLRAAIKATCRECDGTGQGEPSWDGEKYSPRDCVKCGGSDAV